MCPDPFKGHWNNFISYILSKITYQEDDKRNPYFEAWGEEIAFHSEKSSVFRICFMFLQTFHVNLSSEQNLRWNWVIYCHALNILYLFFPLISFFSEVLGKIEITMNWLLLWILGKGTGLVVSEKMAGIGGGRPRMGRVEGKVSRPKNRRSTQKSTITDINRGMVFASSRNQAKSNSLFQTRQGRKRPIYWLSRTVVSRFFPCLSYVILMQPHETAAYTNQRLRLKALKWPLCHSRTPSAHSKACDSLPAEITLLQHQSPILSVTCHFTQLSSKSVNRAWKNGCKKNLKTEVF